MGKDARTERPPPRPGYMTLSSTTGPPVHPCCVKEGAFTRGDRVIVTRHGCDAASLRASMVSRPRKYPIEIRARMVRKVRHHEATTLAAPQSASPSMVGHHAALTSSEHGE